MRLLQQEKPPPNRNSNPPTPHHHHGDEGFKSEEKLITKWFEIMPEFWKGQSIFPHKRILYNQAYRDTPTPPPKLCSILPLTPLTLVRPS